MLRSGLLRYTLHTCRKLWWYLCSKCQGMDYFGIYFTHVQSCDVTCVQSATEWTASVHKLHTCPKLWCDLCSKCYGVDCFGTYFTHVQSCDVTPVQSATEWTASHFTHVQRCDVTRVQSATEWTASVHTSHIQSCDVTRLQSAKERTASVHTSHMSKAVMIPVFKVPGNGLLRYILHTRPKLWCNLCSKCYGVDCLGT